jgi:hypothetical protein
LQDIFIAIAGWACLASMAIVSGCNSRVHQLAEKHLDHGSNTLNGPNDPPSSSGARPSTGSATFTKITVHHVIFHESSGIRLKASWIQGRLYPTRPNIVPSLDDPTSFQVEVESGLTTISLGDLSQSLVSGVLKDSKLTRVKISTHGSRQIEIAGTLHRVVPLPVKLLGDIEATPEGRLSIRITSIKVLKIPVKGFLRAVNLRPSDLVNVGNSKAVQVNGDSILLETEALLPPPRKSGKITGVHFTQNGELEEDYGSLNVQQEFLRRGKTQNFLALTGGAFQLGKLTMRDADLTLIDSSPGDWFEFDLAHYHSQLESGDIHMTGSGGLIIFTPDITKVNSSFREQSEARDYRSPVF